MRHAKVVYCEMCGRPTTNPVKVLVEGTVMTLCPSCASKVKGKIVREEEHVTKKPIKKRNVDVIDRYDIVEDYASRIREARERLGMTRKELAVAVKEREVTIAKIERGELKPSLDLARRLEKVLGIRLVVSEEEEYLSSPKLRRGELTLGEIAVIRTDEE